MRRCPVSGLLGPEMRIPRVQALAMVEQGAAPGMGVLVGVVDDDLAIVGTANCDNRSFRLNFEVIASVYGPEIAARLGAAFEDDLAHAREVRPRALQRERSSRTARDVRWRTAGSARPSICAISA